MKELKINPADYDYMNDMPLEGFMWEFIRRNPGYREIYSYFLKAPPHFQNWMKKLNVLRENYAISPLVTEEELVDSEHYLLLKIPGLSKVFHFYLPNPDSNYNQFSDHNKFFIHGMTPLKAFKMGEDDDLKGVHFKTQEDKLLYIATNVLPPVSMHKTVFVGIATTALREDLKREFNKILERYVPPRTKRKRDKEWKYYLITYDLRNFNPELPFEKIGELLQNAYPTKPVKKKKHGKIIKTEESSLHFFSKENCSDFYEAALRLINGEYKKYLYL